MKRRNEIIWIIWNLSRDSQNSQSRSYWRYIPYDIRNLILDEICSIWRRETGKNRKELFSICKLIHNHLNTTNNSIDLQSKKKIFKLIEKK